MKKIFGIFLLLIFASCVAKNDEQTKIRIVDLQGKAHPVTTRVPELNAQAMTMQGNMPQHQPEVKAPQNYTQNNPDYGVVSTETIQKTFQAPPKEINAENKDDTMLAAGAVQKDQVVEYDLSEADGAKKVPEKKLTKKEKLAAAKSKKSTKAGAATAAKSGKFFVQVGSFGSISNANQTLAAMKKFHSGKVETIEGEKTIYRVLLGPFSTRKSANALVKEITDSGHDAILVRNK